MRRPRRDDHVRVYPSFASSRPPRDGRPSSTGAPTAWPTASRPSCSRRRPGPRKSIVHALSARGLPVSGDEEVRRGCAAYEALGRRARPRPPPRGRSAGARRGRVGERARDGAADARKDRGRVRVGMGVRSTQRWSRSAPTPHSSWPTCSTSTAWLRWYGRRRRGASSRRAAMRRPFAHLLRSMGIDAQSARPRRDRRARRLVKRLAAALDLARSRRSRTGKEEAIAEALADHRRMKATTSALATAARIASGRILPVGDGRALGVGGSLLMDVIRRGDRAGRRRRRRVRAQDREISPRPSRSCVRRIDGAESRPGIGSRGGRAPRRGPRRRAGSRRRTRAPRASLRRGRRPSRRSTCARRSAAGCASARRRASSSARSRAPSVHRSTACARPRRS